MIKVVLDEIVPADLARLLGSGDIDVAAFPEDWRSLPDGEVIDLAVIEGHDWLITCDKHMPFQQNLAGKALSVMVLPSSRIRDLEAIRAALHNALLTPFPGQFVLLDGIGGMIGSPAAHLIGPARTS